MTAPAPETTVDLAALPPSVVVPGIAGWLGRANYQASLDAGLTETFEEFCDRISQQPGDVHTEIRRLRARANGARSTCRRRHGRQPAPPGGAVSIVDRIPGLKGTGSHRAHDRIAELEEFVGQLCEENVILHNRQAAADDFFMIQDQYATDLEAELAQEKRAHAATQADLQTRNRWVADLAGRLADATRRLDIRKLAETAAERT
jgi:hypothetical protein